METKMKKEINKLKVTSKTLPPHQKKERNLSVLALPF